MHGQVVSPLRHPQNSPLSPIKCFLGKGWCTLHPGSGKLCASVWGALDAVHGFGIAQVQKEDWPAKIRSRFVMFEFWEHRIETAQMEPERLDRPEGVGARQAVH